MKARIATKQVEAKLLKVAEEFKRNPYKVLPKCQGNCRSCYFEKLRKEIDKLKEEKFLKKIANKKGFIAALANIILLAEQKIPYVAYMNIEGKNIYYAKRGKVKDELLVGLQNWDEADLRMLAYIELARKNKLNLFSVEDKIICSSEVPEEFLDYMKRKINCNEEEYIIIKWKGREFRACSRKNSLHEMKKYFYYPDFEKEVEIDVKINVLECEANCKECKIKDAIKKGLDLKHYMEGMGDKKFIENYKKKIMWNIEKEKVFIIGNKCYGDDMKKFMDVLQPKEWEVDAIKEILSNAKHAIVVEQASSAKLLEMFGIDYKKLQEEFLEKKKKEKLGKLPEIKGNEIAKFIDRLIRIYKADGKQALLKEIKQINENFKKKAISYAFIVALDIKGEEWKYGKNEREFGEYLAKKLKKALVMEGEEYKKAIESLAMEVG